MRSGTEAYWTPSTLVQLGKKAMQKPTSDENMEDGTTSNARENETTEASCQRSSRLVKQAIGQE